MYIKLLYSITFKKQKSISSSAVSGSYSLLDSIFLSFLQVPEARTPLKLILQHLSFPPFSSLSPPQIKGSPRSLASRLFSLGKTGSFSFSTPSNSPADKPEPGQHSDLQTSDLRPKVNLSSTVEGGGAGQVEDSETEDITMDSKPSPEGARQYLDSNKEMDCESITDEEILYEAESPDEAALVHAAHAYRCTLRGRSADRLMVDLPGVGSLDVQLLHILPFDCNRKRMSVVVRHPLSGQVVVYTKGADSVIMDLCETPKGKSPVCSG